MTTSSEPLTDHRALDWLAVAATTRIVERVRDEHLNLHTPCTGWRVRDLLRHMVGNNRGFTAAAEGRPPDRAVWDGIDLDSDADLRGEWQRSAEAVVAAFEGLTRADRTLAIPGYGDVPAPQAVRMHFIDYLVHGWDLAVSIGVDPELDEESCREVLRIAAQWPPGTRRSGVRALRSARRCPSRHVPPQRTGCSACSVVRRAGGTRSRSSRADPPQAGSLHRTSAGSTSRIVNDRCRRPGQAVGIVSASSHQDSGDARHRTHPSQQGRRNAVGRRDRQRSAR